MRTEDNKHLSKYYTNQSIRKKIDKRLQEHSSLEATLGTDSTVKEIKKVYRQQLELEREIKKLDLEFWNVTFKIIKE